MRGWGEELFERGREQGLARGLEEGVIRGRVQDILRILSVRGVPVDEAARQRILTCTDMPTLDRWFDNSLNATSLAAVFDGPAQ